MEIRVCVIQGMECGLFCIGNATIVAQRNVPGGETYPLGGALVPRDLHGLSKALVGGGPRLVHLVAHPAEDDGHAGVGTLTVRGLVAAGTPAADGAAGVELEYPCPDVDQVLGVHGVAPSLALPSEF